MRLRDMIATALGNKAREFELDFRIVRPNDHELRWIHARRLPFYDAAGKPVRVVGVSVDVTDRKREMVELRKFTEALEAAVKDRTRSSKPNTKPASGSRNRSARRKRWKRSGSSPAALRTTSTIC